LVEKIKETLSDAKGSELASVVAFPSTADAFAFAHAAEGTGLTGRLIPVPRQLSSGCGIAWREPAEHRALIDDLLEGSDIVIEQIAELELR